MISLLESINETLRTTTPWLTLALGAALMAYAPHHRIRVQMLVKHHELTEANGHRLVGMVRWSSAAMTGLGLMLVVIEFVNATLA
jgi:hypothetical protein